MRACRNASIVFFAIALPMIAFGACHEATRPDVPPVTSATPTTTETAVAAEAAASAPKAPSVDESPVVARFVENAATMTASSPCARMLVAAVRGPVTVTSTPTTKDSLGAGDVGVYVSAAALDVKGPLAVVATYTPKEPCPTTAAPAFVHSVVKAAAAPELRFAKGAMSAHLDVGAKVSPDLYLGRLEGTAAVPEHNHPTSWEILATLEASGAFTLDGVEQRLGPKQIVVVPQGAKHSWKPDPGSKLVAIQMYAPPGPEQRFVALAAAEKDAGK